LKHELDEVDVVVVVVVAAAVVDAVTYFDYEVELKRCEKKEN